MNLLTLLKGKLLVAVVTGIVLVGGATAAFAATSAGQTVVQTLTHGRPTVTVIATPGTKHDGQDTGKSNQGQRSCPGLSDAQKLATSYHLSTDSLGDAVKAICALHQGTFKGTTSDGATVTASRVYGYGEIDQLLTYAQYLASQDKTQTAGKLSDTNASSYLAAALKSCGTSPLQTCLQANIPNYQPGNRTVTPTPNGNKPSATPIPNGNKPSATPTPNGNKPSATPTPHH